MELSPEQREEIQRNGKFVDDESIAPSYPWRQELARLIATFTWTGSANDPFRLADDIIKNWHEEHCDRNDLAIQLEKSRASRSPLQRMLDGGH